jgi:hydroxymethylpyrimidine/phosphomethylpyrimidine kinase
MSTLSVERLANERTVEAWHKLLPRVTVLTPSASEAALLTAKSVRTIAQAEDAALSLCKLGAKAVLIKGRELQDNPDLITDVFCTSDGIVRMTAARIPSQSHGTGDTLASAIAANLALGVPLEHAVRLSQAYVRHLLRCTISRGAGLPVLAHESAIKFSQTETASLKNTSYCLQSKTNIR